MLCGYIVTLPFKMQSPLFRSFMAVEDTLNLSSTGAHIFAPLILSSTHKTHNAGQQQFQPWRQLRAIFNWESAVQKTCFLECAPFFAIVPSVPFI